MPDFEQKIQPCYHNPFFVTKDMRKKNFHRSCPERINLSWFVTTLSSAKTKHLPGILNCRHFDGVCFCFYGNSMAPIPSRAEITQATLSMRSHFAAVSTTGILVFRGRAPFGQHQDTEHWNNQLPESKILGLPVSRRMRGLVYMAYKVDVDTFLKGIQYAQEKLGKSL